MTKTPVNLNSNDKKAAALIEAVFNRTESSFSFENKPEKSTADASQIIEPEHLSPDGDNKQSGIFENSPTTQNNIDCRALDDIGVQTIDQGIFQNSAIPAKNSFPSTAVSDTEDFDQDVNLNDKNVNNNLTNTNKSDDTDPSALVEVGFVSKMAHNLEDLLEKTHITNVIKPDNDNKTPMNMNARRDEVRRLKQEVLVLKAEVKKLKLEIEQHEKDKSLNKVEECNKLIQKWEEEIREKNNKITDYDIDSSEINMESALEMFNNLGKEKEKREAEYNKIKEKHNKVENVKPLPPTLNNDNEQQETISKFSLMRLDATVAHDVILKKNTQLIEEESEITESEIIENEIIESGEEVVEDVGEVEGEVVEDVVEEVEEVVEDVVEEVIESKVVEEEEEFGGVEENQEEKVNVCEACKDCDGDCDHCTKECDNCDLEHVDDKDLNEVEENNTNEEYNNETTNPTESHDDSMNETGNTEILGEKTTLEHVLDTPVPGSIENETQILNHNNDTTPRPPHIDPTLLSKDSLDSVDLIFPQKNLSRNLNHNTLTDLRDSEGNIFDDMTRQVITIDASAGDSASCQIIDQGVFENKPAMNSTAHVRAGEAGIQKLDSGTFENRPAAASTAHVRSGDVGVQRLDSGTYENKPAAASTAHVRSGDVGVQRLDSGTYENKPAAASTAHVRSGEVGFQKLDSGTFENRPAAASTAHVRSGDVGVQRLDSGTYENKPAAASTAHVRSGDVGVQRLDSGTYENKPAAASTAHVRSGDVGVQRLDSGTYENKPAAASTAHVRSGEVGFQKLDSGTYENKPAAASTAHFSASTPSMQKVYSGTFENEPTQNIIRRTYKNASQVYNSNDSSKTNPPSQTQMETTQSTNNPLLNKPTKYQKSENSKINVFQPNNPTSDDSIFENPPASNANAKSDMPDGDSNVFEKRPYEPSTDSKAEEPTPGLSRSNESHVFDDYEKLTAEYSGQVFDKNGDDDDIMFHLQGAINDLKQGYKH